MSYIDVQTGSGIGQDALNYVKEHKQQIKDGLYENRERIFQVTSNAQRFVSKRRGNKKPIRYLEKGEIHLPNHNFTGPGTMIEQEHVRNHAPYNDIDACSKVHDIEFDRLFKLPLGKERSEGIRKADRAALECYAQHKEQEGFRLAYGGINTKILLEDLDPSLFDTLMGKEYRGAAAGMNDEKTVELGQPIDAGKKLSEPRKPRKPCKGRNRRKCLKQRGGNFPVLSGSRVPYLGMPLHNHIQHDPEYELNKALIGRLIK